MCSLRSPRRSLNQASAASILDKLILQTYTRQTYTRQTYITSIILFFNHTFIFIIFIFIFLLLILEVHSRLSFQTLLFIISNNYIYYRPFLEPRCMCSLRSPRRSLNHASAASILYISTIPH